MYQTYNDLYSRRMVIPTDRLYYQQEQLRSVKGVQQGDPFGPLLFCLVLHDVLSLLPELEPAPSTMVLTKLVCLFYLDDGYIVGSHKHVTQVLKHLDGQHAKNAGLHLRRDKCKRFWAAQLNEELDLYPTDIGTVSSVGIKILGSPVGTDMYAHMVTTEQIMEVQETQSRLIEIRDKHCAFTILRECFGTCRMAYLARTTPTAQILNALRYYDDLTLDVFRSIIGGVLPEYMENEITLPVRMPNLCVGLTKSGHTAAACYISSAVNIYLMMREVTPSKIYANYLQNQQLSEAHRLWSLQIRISVRLVLREIRDRKHSQREYTSTSPIFLPD